MYGIKNFTSIINPPQSCIIAVGAGEERPVVRERQDRNRHRDDRHHVRPITGWWTAAPAPSSSQTLKQFIEEPASMLL